MLRMPIDVLMMIGQIDVMKMTKIADGWPSRKPASEIGSHASGGTGMMASGGSPGSAKPRQTVFAACITAPGSTDTTTGNVSIVSALFIHLLLGSGRLDVLDRLALEVLLRVGRVEHLAVEEL